MNSTKNTLSQAIRERRDWRTKDDMAEWCISGQQKSRRKELERQARISVEGEKLLRKAGTHLRPSS